jgi:hypothetical protein
MGRLVECFKQDKVSEEDHYELLEIVQELNKALKHEEQVRRDFREAKKAGSSGELHS